MKTTILYDNAENFDLYDLGSDELDVLRFELYGKALGYYDIEENDTAEILNGSVFDISMEMLAKYYDGVSFVKEDFYDSETVEKSGLLTVTALTTWSRRGNATTTLTATIHDKSTTHKNKAGGGGYDKRALTTRFSLNDAAADLLKYDEAAAADLLDHLATGSAPLEKLASLEGWTILADYHNDELDFVKIQTAVRREG